MKTFLLWICVAGVVYLAVTNLNRRVVVVRDTGTNCEYLSSAAGGITPRLDSAGKQICGDPE
jgi:hypothetical protein